MIGNIYYVRGEDRCLKTWNHITKGMKRGKSEILVSNIMIPMKPAESGCLFTYLISRQQTLCHVSLSFADQDKINTEIMRYVAEDFLCRYIGFTRKKNIRNLINQACKENKPLPELPKYEIANIYEKIDNFAYAVVRHYDTTHRHLHIVFDCYDITTDESIVMSPLWLARRMTELIIRQIEKEYGFTQVENSWVIRKREGRTGKPMLRCYVKNMGYKELNKLRAVLKELIASSSNWGELKARAKMNKIDIEKHGEILVYRRNRAYIKPRQLGYSYTIEAIERSFDEKRGIELQPERSQEKAGTNEIEYY